MSIQPTTITSTTNANSANFPPPPQQHAYPQQAAQVVSQTTNQLPPQSNQLPNFLLTASRIQDARQQTSAQQAPTSPVPGYTGSVSQSSLLPIQSRLTLPTLGSSQVLTSQVPASTGSVSRSSLPSLQSSRLTLSTLGSSQVLTSQVPASTESVSQATNQLSQSNTFSNPWIPSSNLQGPGQLQASVFDSQAGTQRTARSGLPPLFTDFSALSTTPTVTPTPPRSPRQIEELKNIAKVEKWVKKMRLMKKATEILEQEEQVKALGNTPEAITVETLLDQLQDATLSKELLSLCDIEAYKIDALKEKFGYRFFYTVRVSDIKSLTDQGYSVVLLENTYASKDITNTYPMTSNRLQHEGINEHEGEVHFTTQINSKPYAVTFEPLLIKDEVVIAGGAKDGLVLKECATNTIRFFPQEDFPLDPNIIRQRIVQVAAPTTTTTTTIQQAQPVVQVAPTTTTATTQQAQPVVQVPTMTTSTTTTPAVTDPSQQQGQGGTP